MNNDRFLTRVYDKQEKKMLYPGTEFKYGDYEDPFIFQCIANQHFMCCSPARSSYIESWAHLLIAFGDRFVPTMCLGRQDKNKKLIYADDIIATSNNKYLVYWDEESAAFWFKRLDNECELLIDDFSCEIEIIGNRWENEKLLEGKA